MPPIFKREANELPAPINAVPDIFTASPCSSPLPEGKGRGQGGRGRGSGPRFDHLGVKQFVAVVENERGHQFFVFTTDDEKYYLFSAVDDQGVQKGFFLPVLRKNLRDEIRRALHHGYGNSYLGKRRDEAMAKSCLFLDGGGI